MCWNLTGTCLYCPPVSSRLLFLFEPHLIVLHIDVTVFRFPIDFLLWNSYYTHHTFDSGAFLNTSQSLCTQWLSESALFRLPSALATGGPVPLDRRTSYRLFQVINFPLDFKYFFRYFYRVKTEASFHSQPLFGTRSPRSQSPQLCTNICPRRGNGL